MNQDNYIKEKNNRATVRQKIYPFFWFIAAADDKLLRSCAIPEQDKFAGIGMAILCTTLAASLSCFYAVSSLFNNVSAAVLIAIFWGIIIFNLDRFMIGSMKKKKNNNIFEELKIASPRIILALFIAIIISKPVELRIFKNQIDLEKISYSSSLINASTADITNEIKETTNERNNADKAYERAYENSKNLNSYPPYQNAKSTYDASVQQAETYKAAIKANYIARRDFKSRGESTVDIDQSIIALHSQIKNLGVQDKKKEMEKIGQAYIAEQHEILEKERKKSDALSNQISRKGAAKDNKVADVSKKDSVASNDILGELRLLNIIKKRDEGLKWADWLITALFFILEIAPIMVKIMSPRGEYDALIAIGVQKALDHEEAEEEESRQEMNARKQAANQNTIEAANIDELVKRRIQEKIMEAQAKLAEKIIDAWEAQQEAELHANQNGYIKDFIS